MISGGWKVFSSLYYCYKGFNFIPSGYCSIILSVQFKPFGAGCYYIMEVLDIRDIKQMKEFIVKTGNKHCIAMRTETFHSGEALIKALKAREFHLIFLDIDLITIYGIEIGVDIRENFNDNKTQIVYVSAYDSYAMELFQVRPINFLVKHIDEEKIEKTILLSLELNDASNLYFGFVIERKVVKVPLDSILYFECLSKKMRLVTRNKEYCFYGSKKDILAKVPEGFLLAIHNSYLINCDYVLEYGTTEVVMCNNDILPVSRNYRKNIKDALLNMRSEKNALR